MEEYPLEFESKYRNLLSRKFIKDMDKKIAFV